MSLGLALTRIVSGTSPLQTVHRTICWGTHSEARRICPKHFGTRRWAHAWVRRHMEPLPLGELRVLDAGSGLSNRLLDWYRPRVKHAYLLDFLLDSRVEGNTSIVRADLEKGIPMPDASVDLVTSVSSIEHLSAAGQVLFFREAERVLCPGGFVALTVSYNIGLDKRKLDILSIKSDPGEGGFYDQRRTQPAQDAGCGPFLKSSGDAGVEPISRLRRILRRETALGPRHHSRYHARRSRPA